MKINTNKNEDKFLDSIIKDMHSSSENLEENNSQEIIGKLIYIWEKTSKSQRFHQFMFNINESFTNQILDVPYRVFHDGTQYTKDLFHVEDKVFLDYLNKVIENIENGQEK